MWGIRANCSPSWRQSWLNYVRMENYFSMAPAAIATCLHLNSGIHMRAADQLLPFRSQLSNTVSFFLETRLRSQQRLPSQTSYLIHSSCNSVWINKKQMDIWKHKCQSAGIRGNKSHWMDSRHLWEYLLMYAWTYTQECDGLVIKIVNYQ